MIKEPIEAQVSQNKASHDKEPIEAQVSQNKASHDKRADRGSGIPKQGLS